MTDKQIIIDGIDVGGCIYYEDGKCLNGEMVQCNCKKVAVCYYKEYKRKEQECENNKIAYQMELDIYNQECLNLQEELKAKEQECEELKAKCKKYGEINEQETKDYAELKAENDELRDKNNILKNSLKPFQDEYFKGLDNVVIAELAKKSIRITAENRKLEQTLTEIKEIVFPKNQLIITDSPIILKIQEKISECEGNDE